MKEESGSLFLVWSFPGMLAKPCFLEIKKNKTGEIITRFEKLASSCYHHLLLELMFLIKTDANLDWFGNSLQNSTSLKKIAVFATQHYNAIVCLRCTSPAFNCRCRRTDGMVNCSFPKEKKKKRTSYVSWSLISFKTAVGIWIALNSFGALPDRKVRFSPTVYWLCSTNGCRTIKPLSVSALEIYLPRMTFQVHWHIENTKQTYTNVVSGTENTAFVLGLFLLSLVKKYKLISYQEEFFQNHLIFLNHIRNAQR